MDTSQWNAAISAAKAAKEALNDPSERYGAQYVIVAIAEAWERANAQDLAREGREDFLKGKSEKEIRRAATFWFMAQDSIQRGENVPANIFALSTEGLTESDIDWAHRMAAANGWVNQQRQESVEVK